MLSFLVKAVKGFNISKLFLKNFQMLCPANCGVQAGVCQNGEQGTDYCSYDLAYDRLFLDVACGSVLYSFVLLVLMRTTAGLQHITRGISNRIDFPGSRAGATSPRSSTLLTPPLAGPNCQILTIPVSHDLPGRSICASA